MRPRRAGRTPVKRRGRDARWKLVRNGRNGWLLVHTGSDRRRLGRRLALCQETLAGRPLAGRARILNPLDPYGEPEARGLEPAGLPDAPARILRRDATRGPAT